MNTEYYYPKLGEELGPHQPNLEYKQTNGTWVESGLISGRLTSSFIGHYRVKLIKELVMVDTKRIRKNLGTRESIGLKRSDVIPLLDAYELAVARNPPDYGIDFNDSIADQLGVDNLHKERTVSGVKNNHGMRFPADFDGKHSDPKHEHDKMPCPPNC